MAIRQEIHYSSDEFHRRLADAELLRHFPTGIDLDGAQLTRPPRGYAADDPNLPWLKLKSFGVGRLFSDAAWVPILSRAWWRASRRPGRGSSF